MNNELFERLLFEEENTTLDFKKKQYRFVKSTDEEKSELLKDILGFANAWRRSKAFILIGVEDVRGGRGKIVGIPASDHLDDHSLQQFVNNLTNQPVRFHYEAFGFEGKQIGIISIDEHTRPIYLKRDYGKLAREKVYVRRGSSTDPTKPASLEEIAQMGIGLGQPAAELLVEFAHVERDDALGTNISWEAEYCKMPPPELIPDLSPPKLANPLGINLSMFQYDPMNRLNHNFFRETANFEFSRRLLRPIRLVVKNIGQVAATNVRVEMTMPMNIGVIVIDASDFPDPPKQRYNYMGGAVLPSFQNATHRKPGEVDITESGKQYRIEIDCEDLQPGRRVWSDIFYIAKEASGDLSVNGLVLADNLPQPKNFALTVSAKLTRTEMTVDELCSLPELPE